MTRLEAKGGKLRVVYTRRGKTQVWEGESPLPEDETAFLERGGLWTYDLFGQRERYLKVTRRRQLRRTFGLGVEAQGSLYDLPLEAHPFYLEPLAQDEEGRVGILQIGRVIYLVSSWGVLRTPYPLAQQEKRNGLIRLDRKALRSLAKRGAKALWEEALERGLEKVISSVLTYGEELKW